MEDMARLLTIVMIVSGAAIGTIVPIINWTMKKWTEQSKHIKEFEKQARDHGLEKLEKDLNNCWKDVKDLKKSSHMFDEKNKNFEMSHLKLELKIQETLKNLTDLNNRLSGFENSLDKKMTDSIQKELYKLGKMDLK